MASILGFITEYRQNNYKYGIPEFQRKFTWKPKQIENLFDSVFRRYPLPKFFIWRLPQISPVGLGAFPTDFTSKKTKSTPFTNENYLPEGGNIAICDGQQRLTSFIIGCLGKNMGTSRTPKYLYFDILFETLDAEDNEKRFSFLSANQLSRINSDSTRCFLKVSEIIDAFINNHQPYTTIINNYLQGLNLALNQEKYNLAYSNLFQFITNLSQNHYLDFAELETIIGNSLDEAVEFFSRINGGGKALTKNEILYSLLSKYLENVNDGLKTDFDELTENFCESPQRVLSKSLDYDFYLRACLYVTTNEILFNINTFDRLQCVSILESWSAIKRAIEKTMELLQKLHIGPLITSANSIIPIIYHFYRKGENYQALQNEYPEFSKYILRAQFSGVFGSHGDSLLTYLKRNQIDKYQINDYKFSFSDLTSTLPPDKSFSLNEDKIDKILEYEYGDDKTKAILFLVHGNYQNNQSLHIDHIHPSSICVSETRLRTYDVTGDIAFILENHNKISNLQLLQSNCNINKSNITVLDWVRQIFNGYNNNMNDLSCVNGKRNELEYFESNLILIPVNKAIDEYLSIYNFVEFFENRKILLRNILVEKLIDN